MLNLLEDPCWVVYGLQAARPGRCGAGTGGPDRLVKRFTRRLFRSLVQQILHRGLPVRHDRGRDVWVEHPTHLKPDVVGDCSRGCDVRGELAQPDCNDFW